MGGSPVADFDVTQFMSANARGGWRHTHPEMRNRIAAMLAAMPEVRRQGLLISDTARTWDQQVAAARRHGVDPHRGKPGILAPWGRGKHHGANARAVDFYNPHPQTLQWMRQNAPRYGLTFPAWGRRSDPWHMEMMQNFSGPLPAAGSTQVASAANPPVVAGTSVAFANTNAGLPSESPMPPIRRPAISSASRMGLGAAPADVSQMRQLLETGQGSPVQMPELPAVATPLSSAPMNADVSGIPNKMTPAQMPQIPGSIPRLPEVVVNRPQTGQQFGFPGRDDIYGAGLPQRTMDYTALRHGDTNAGPGTAPQGPSSFVQSGLQPPADAGNGSFAGGFQPGGAIPGIRDDSPSLRPSGPPLRMPDNGNGASAPPPPTANPQRGQQHPGVRVTWEDGGGNRGLQPVFHNSPWDDPARRPQMMKNSAGVGGMGSFFRRMFR